MTATHPDSLLHLPPYGRKNLAVVSYTNPVIVNSAPNFVAITTGVDMRKKFKMTPLNHSNISKS